MAAAATIASVKGYSDELMKFLLSWRLCTDLMEQALAYWHTSCAWGIGSYYHPQSGNQRSKLMRCEKSLLEKRK